MSIRTIRSKNELEDLVREHPLVFVVGVRDGFAHGDMEFEKLAQESDSGQGKILFARFVVEEVPQLEQEYDIRDIATLVYFLDGQQYEIAGFEPPKWKAFVQNALDRAG